MTTEVSERVRSDRDGFTDKMSTHTGQVEDCFAACYHLLFTCMLAAGPTSDPRSVA